MLLDGPGRPLRLADVPEPEPLPGQVRIRISACAVCRTDLHVFDGEVTASRFPLILGHQIVGVVDRLGGSLTSLAVGDRVGVTWLAWTCGVCVYCTSGRENLCVKGKFTGCDVDGGFAEYTVADARFCFPLPASENDGADADAHLAPWLCAGLIGHRAHRMAGDAQRLGLYGFGAAAHLVAQAARYEGRRVFAFTRPGDDKAQRFARSLGVEWAGGSDEKPPTELDAAIIFASAGPLVPAALSALAKGGNVVCGGIHMSDIPAFPYSLLWGERSVRSVANLTRHDGSEFLALAPRVPVRTEVTIYPLERAGDALDDLRHGRFSGSAVLKIAAD
jgi:propanol-preferring alcohol dehydrogenase